MEEEIVFKGKSKKGTEFIIRYPSNNDAQALCNYINTLSREKTFIRFQGEQISLDEETKYLNDLLQKIEKRQAILLLVICNDQLSGVCNVNLKDKTESHEAVLGITLLKKHRQEGIGAILFKIALEEAKKNLSGIKIITLGVFGNNEVAQNLYKKFGFKEFGRLPKGLHYKGEYIDHVYMYKEIS